MDRRTVRNNQDMKSLVVEGFQGQNFPISSGKIFRKRLVKACAPFTFHREKQMEYFDCHLLDSFLLMSHMYDFSLLFKWSYII